MIAAVIERSFRAWSDDARWIEPLDPAASRHEQLVAMLQHTGRTLAESPDFLRLGLMLALERRPTEASARALFLTVRDESHQRLVDGFRALFGDGLDDAGVETLATFTMAAADGLFIAHEVDPAGVDLERLFGVLAAAVLGVADELTAARRSR